MSRIGKKIINIPEKVEIQINDGLIMVKGPKGELKQKLPAEISLTMDKSQATINPKDASDKKQKALWGTWRQLINNMILGVTEGFEKKLEINGVGYKAEIKNNILVLNIGYSHPVNFPIPTNIKIIVDKNIITVSGFDKYLVGETAAAIRKTRKPEPYKGKGIKYLEEIIRRKAGKQVKSATAK